MKSITCFRAIRRRAAALNLLFLPCLLAQSSGIVTIAPIEKARIKRGEEFNARMLVRVKPGFHVNSNKPKDEYLIPLKLTWTGPLLSEDVIFPKAEEIKSPFSEKPLVVFTGGFDIVTRFKVPANAPDGPNLETGKLRYQACNEKECLKPQTVDVNLSLEIR